MPPHLGKSLTKRTKVWHQQPPEHRQLEMFAEKQQGSVHLMHPDMDDQHSFIAELRGIWSCSESCSASPAAAFAGRHGGRVPVGDLTPGTCMGCVNVINLLKKAADAGATTLHQTVVGTGTALEYRYLQAEMKSLSYTNTRQNGTREVW